MNIINVEEGYKIGFRPRDVIFDCDQPDEDAVVIRTKIISFENHGSEFLYLIEINGQKAFVKELSKTKREVGSDLTFSLAKNSVYVFDENDNRVYDGRTTSVYERFKASGRTVQ